MALLGELAVNLVARTSKFEAGMKKGSGSLSKFKTQAERTKKSLGLVKTAIGGLAAAFTTGFIARSIFETAEAVDALGKKSQLLGLTTEALGGLRHAAEQTGVAADTFDMALQRMVRRVAEAATGTGEAKDALIELGLKAEDLAKLEADEQFKRIADAMNQVTDQSARVRLGFKLFDSEGVKLVNTLKLGSDGLERMQTEAEKLGILVSGKEAENMAEFVDAVDKLGKVSGSFKRDFVIDVTPAATESIQGALLLLEAFRKDKERGGFIATEIDKSLEGRNLLQRLSPAAQAGRIGVEQLFERTGVSFRAPAIQESERLDRAPANFVEARGQRNPLDLRELRIQELKELRAESKQGDRKAEDQRERLIDSIETLSRQQQPQAAAANIPP